MNYSIYSIYSTEYLEQEVSSYNCYVKEDEWIRITNEFPDKRIFARIINGDKHWIVALGQPIRPFERNIEADKPIFVPTWMLEQIQISGDGSNYDIDWMPSDAFDHSTHIVLKPDEYMYQCDDIQEQLSIELTKLGILQKYSVISIEMPSLDNFVIKYRVIDLSPASVVLCEGDEVSLEFIEEKPLPLHSVVGRPPSPYPVLPELLYEENSIVPTVPSDTTPIEEKSGIVLGGVKREGRFNPWRSKDFKPPSL